MSVINMVKTIKEINTDTVILVKSGKFYNVYGKDAYILSYLFHYKIRKIEEKYFTCGFSENAIYKVQTNLENKNINYMCVIAAHNYEVVENVHFKNKNQYKKIFSIAQKYLIQKNRIDAIHEKMIVNITNKNINEMIGKIEEILNEI